MLFLLTIIAVSTKSTTSVTFSLLNDAQFSSFSLNSTSSQSLISFPNDKYTCVVADIIALLCSFRVYVCSAVKISFSKTVYLKLNKPKKLYSVPA